jgi:hypothetical protein
MDMKRLYDLLSVLPVDKRTLKKAVKAAGIKLVYIGGSGPLVTAQDFESIKTAGIPYYRAKMTTKGIR